MTWRTANHILNTYDLDCKQSSPRYPLILYLYSIVININCYTKLNLKKHIIGYNITKHCNLQKIEDKLEKGKP